MNGAYGVGLLAFERLAEAMPSIAFTGLFLGSIWLIIRCRA